MKRRILKNIQGKNDKNQGALSSMLLFLFVMIGANTFASEKDLYDFLWLDPDKKVYVLQNKTYQKENTYFVNLGYVKNNSSEFQSTNGIHFSTGYYFHEEWAIELKYHQYNNSDNDAYKNIRQVSGVVPFIRKPEKSYSAMVVWSPFYGKINTFNKIIYLDWSFGVGPGRVHTESNATTVADENTAEIFNDESYLGITAKSALRIHISPSMHVGVEYHRDNYRAPGPSVRGNATTKWRNISDTVISLGFSF